MGGMSNSAINIEYPASGRKIIAMTRSVPAAAREKPAEALNESPLDQPCADIVTWRAIGIACR